MCQGKAKKVPNLPIIIRDLVQISENIYFAFCIMMTYDDDDRYLMILFIIMITFNFILNI
jgi:hypothetical protein